MRTRPRRTYSQYLTQPLHQHDHPDGLEIWAPVVDYEGDYEVSTYGRVCSLKYGRRRILKLQKGYFYWQVNLSKNGQHRTIAVHLLVAQAFLGERPAGTQCCHGGDNKNDNSIWNLRYDTPLANVRECGMNNHSVPPIGSCNGQAKLDEPRVSTIKQQLKIGMTAVELSSEHGVHRRTIQDIANGVSWKHVT